MEFVETTAVAEEAVVEEEAVAEEVVGDEDAAIVITTAKAIVKIAGVKPEAAIELIETTALACHLC